jgi:predicted  nucleic acid-binding Zn-ribbon protein
LRQQLELLFEVQTIDTNIRNSEELQKKYHDDIAKLEQEVENKEKSRKNKQEQLKDLEKEYRNQERSLNSLEEQEKKIEDKLLSIKTNREYQAALHEIENIKGLISKKEDEVIEIMDNIESAKAFLKEADENLKKTKAQYEEKKKQIEEKLKIYLDDIEKQKKRREVLFEKIDPDIFADYTRIQNVKQGLAVVVTENEQCLGCSMKIPPQIYNEVVCGEKLITCPNCHRILFVIHDSDKNEEEGDKAIG